jgi:hypothetical protein
VAKNKNGKEALTHASQLLAKPNPPYFSTKCCKLQKLVIKTLAQGNGEILPNLFEPRLTKEKPVSYYFYLQVASYLFSCNILL